MENPFADIDLESDFDGRRACDWCETMTSPAGLVPESETKRAGLVVCRHCWVHREEIAAKQNAAVQLQLGLAKIVSAARRSRLNESPMQHIYTTLYDQFDGDIEGFCKSWKTALDAAITKDPGSKAVLDTHYAFFKVAQAAAADRNEIHRDFSHLNLEQIQQACVQFVQDNPEVLQAVQSLPNETLIDADPTD